VLLSVSCKDWDWARQAHAILQHAGAENISFSDGDALAVGDRAA
jgi:hypothetical protein